MICNSKMKEALQRKVAAALEEVMVGGISIAVTDCNMRGATIELSITDEHGTPIILAGACEVGRGDRLFFVGLERTLNVTIGE